MSIHVQLERFEGPLGLLLHLIREQEMDIFNINIHHITRQYLDYIRAMRRLDLEVAGEFVAMAATLLHIKSRMLLPQYNEEGEVVAVDDPRKELVQKLIEYKRFKELSGELARRAWLGRDVFTRGEREVIEPEVAESELVLEENPLFSLIASYRNALRNMKKSVHKVAGELQSIASRILEMRPKLVIGQRVVFQDFITASENVSSQVLVTFLSLLELAKMGLISVFQSEPFADIHVETKHEVDQSAVSRAENYDSVNSDLKAQAIIHDAALSLDEPVSVLEGEDEAVVEAMETDAASDDEIAAEESRLFGEFEGSSAAEVNAPDLPRMDTVDEAEAMTASSSATESVVTEAETVTPIAGEVERAETSMFAAPDLDFIENPDARIDMVLNSEALEVADAEDAAIDDAIVEEETLSAAERFTAAEPEALVSPESAGSVELESAILESAANEPTAAEADTSAAEPVAELNTSAAEVPSKAELNAPAAEGARVPSAEDACVPSMEAAKAPPPAEKSERENISSALSAAFSAFDAFEEIPTPPPADKPPEVNE